VSPAMSVCVLSLCLPLPPLVVWLVCRPSLSCSPHRALPMYRITPLATYHPASCHAIVHICHPHRKHTYACHYHVHEQRVPLSSLPWPLSCPVFSDDMLWWPARSGCCPSLLLPLPVPSLPILSLSSARASHCCGRRCAAAACVVPALAPCSSLVVSVSLSVSMLPSCCVRA
jgi:hypothetical protein